MLMMIAIMKMMIATNVVEMMGESQHQNAMYVDVLKDSRPREARPKNLVYIYIYIYTNR